MVTEIAHLGTIYYTCVLSNILEKLLILLLKQQFRHFREYHSEKVTYGNKVFAETIYSTNDLMDLHGLKV